MSPKLKQLTNLLGRGRALHWSNHVVIAQRAFGKRDYPQRCPPLADFVYRGAQFVMCADLLSRRNYLGEHALAAFAQGLFASLAGENGDRFHSLTTNYADVFDDEDQFAAHLARDLAAAVVGEASAASAFLGAPRAILKITHTYCAQTFGDRELLKRLV